MSTQTPLTGRVSNDPTEELKVVSVKDAIVSLFTSTGIAGFKFHIYESEQVNMESDITDHYVDTNSAVQDHIARRPITITLNGYQGEYFYSVHPIETMVAKIAPVFTLVDVFKPKLDKITKKIQQKQVEHLLNKLNNGNKTAAEEYAKKARKEDFFSKQYNAIDLFQLFQNIYKLKSAQTRAFFYFEALWKSEILFTVETRWKRYNNMVIQKVTPLADNNADITDFSVTFKQINITTSKSESIENVAGRLKDQAAQVIKKGVDKGKEVDTLKPEG